MTVRKLSVFALALSLAATQAFAQTPPAPASTPPVSTTGAVGANAAVLSATGTVLVVAGGLAVMALVVSQSNIPKTAAPPAGTTGTH